MRVVGVGGELVVVEEVEEAAVEREARLEVGAGLLLAADAEVAADSAAAHRALV